MKRLEFLPLCEEFFIASQLSGEAYAQRLGPTAENSSLKKVQMPYNQERSQPFRLRIGD